MMQGRLSISTRPGQQIAVLKADNTPATLYSDVAGSSTLSSHIVTTNAYGSVVIYCSGAIRLVSVATGTVLRDQLNVIPLDLTPANFSGSSDLDKLQQAISAGSATQAVHLVDDLSVSVGGSTLLNAPDATHIRGDGINTSLSVTETSLSGSSSIIDMNADGLVVENLTVDLNKADSGATTTCILVTPDHNDVVLRGLKVDAHVSLLSGTQDRPVFLVSAANTSVEGLRYDSLTAKNFGRAYTRDNANTSNSKRIKGTFNTYQNAWRTVYTFNAPSGSIEDVLVFGDTFDTHAGTVNNDPSMGSGNNAVGNVGVKGGRIIGCHVSGLFGALWHVEENTDGALALGNTAVMRNASASDGAFEWLSNNVGTGSQITPLHLAAIGNVLRSTDGVGVGHYLQSNGADAAQWSLALGNIYTGFDVGFRAATETRSVLIKNNILRGVTTGLRLTRCSLLADGNLIEASSDPLHVGRGGLLGSVHFANLSSATAAMSSWGVTDGGPQAFTEWTWESELFSVASGTSYIDMGPMPQKMFGRMSVAMSFNGSIWRNIETDVSWDGATFAPATTGSAEVKLYSGAGSIAVLPANNSGNLSIKLTNGGATTAASARLQVRFHSGQMIV